MKREVNPDALYHFLLNNWPAWASTVCPEVAEPYDYHADWTVSPAPSGNNSVEWICKYCGRWKSSPPVGRHDCPEQPAPSYPETPDSLPEHDPYCMAGSAPCRKCRERAKAAAKPNHPEILDSSPSEPVIDEAVFDAAYEAHKANAAAKPVTISEAEIIRVMQASCTTHPGEVRVYVEPLFILLRRHGVEVVP